MFERILAAQLTSLVTHFRVVANNHHAHCVTRIVRRRPESPQTQGMGVFDAYLIQMKVMGPEGPQETQKMHFREPYCEYRRHQLPEGIMPGQNIYEIVVESM